MRRSSAPRGLRAGLLLAGALLLLPAISHAGAPVEPAAAPAADPTAATALDLVPEHALAAVGWSGAAALEGPFRATALGGIAAEPRIRELAAALLPAFEGALREHAHDEEHRQLLLFLREALGELWTQPLAVVLHGIEVIEGDPVPQLSLTLGSGAGAERIHATIDAIREREGAPAEPWTGAATARRVAIPDAPISVIYGLERGRLFLSLGEAAATAAVARIRGEGRSLGDAPTFRRAWEPALGRAAPMDWLYVDAPALRARALAILSAAEATLPPLASALLGDDGLGRLGAVLFTVGIDGAGFRRALSIGWRSDAAPGEPIDEETLAIVPRDAGFFSYEDQDIAGCIAALKGFVEGADPDAARQLRGMQAFADGFLGFRLEEELIASLGRRFLLFEEPAASGLVPGLVLVLRPADPAVVQNCAKRLVASAGALAGMKGFSVVARERAGITFVETSGAPVPLAPAWAMRGERLFLALHPTIIEEVFHRLDAPDARDRSILAKEDFRRARGRIGRDQHGIFYSDTGAAVRELYPHLLPLLQAGIAALGGEVRGLSAMQVPPPYLIGDRFFGDIHGCRRTADGWLWEAHGPLPFCLPDIGGATIALLGAGALAGIAEERSQAVAVQQGMALERVVRAHEAAPTLVPAPLPSTDAALRELLAAIEGNPAAGRYPNAAEQILPHLAEGSAARRLLEGGGIGIVFPAEPIAAPAAPGTLLFHTAEPGPHGEHRLGVTGGEIRTATGDELDTAKRLSGWARSARL